MPRLLDFGGPDAPPIPPYRIPPVPAGPGEIVRSWPVGCPVVPCRGVHIVPLAEGVFCYRDEAGARGLLVPGATPSPVTLAPASALPPAVEEPEDYYDLAGAARYTKLAKGTISNAIYEGHIEKEPGSRKVIIKREVLDHYLATERPKPKKPTQSKSKKPARPKKN